MTVWLSFVAVSLVAIGVAEMLFARAQAPELTSLFRYGLIARIFGSVFRYEVMTRQYGFAGDSQTYYESGVVYAESLRAFDLSIFESANWQSDKLWGTQFIRYLSGLVIAFIGESIRAEYVVFALAGFAGLTLIVLSYREVYGRTLGKSFAAWVWLWPSLWFWPATVGKDTMMILATGLAVWGYVGYQGRIRWAPIIAGLALAVMVRPHVAGVVAFSIAVADATRSGALRGFNLFRLVALGALAVAFTAQAASDLGFDSVDIEDVQETFEVYASRTETGNSMIQRAAGPYGVAQAFINVFFRPFPWEATHAFSLASSLEMWGLWGLVWVRRQRVYDTVRSWREQRLLRFALPFLLLGGFMYGFGFANLGILARQRVLLLPFLFILPTAMWSAARRPAAARPAIAQPIR
jgi:hypothetical protein